MQIPRWTRRPGVSLKPLKRQHSDQSPSFPRLQPLLPRRLVLGTLVFYLARPFRRLSHVELLAHLPQAAHVLVVALATDGFPGVAVGRIGDPAVDLEDAGFESLGARLGGFEGERDLRMRGRRRLLSGPGTNLYSVFWVCVFAVREGKSGDLRRDGEFPLSGRY